MFGSSIGEALQSLFGLVLAAWGVYALVVNVSVVAKATEGLVALLLAVFLFPFTIAGAPFYALIKWGDYWPLIVVYGPLTLLALLGTLTGLAMRARGRRAGE